MACGTLTILAASFSLSAPRPAGSAEPRRSIVLQAAYDCLAIATEPQRLACLESSVAALKKAEADGQITVMDRAQSREVRRQAFGLSLPAFSIFNRGPKEDDVGKVALEIAQATPTPMRRWIFITREGPVWEQTDDEPARNPHPGSKLEIERGALGSFFCSVDRQTPVRCARNR